jgi:hypothetical protein
MVVVRRGDGDSGGGGVPSGAMGGARVGDFFTVPFVGSGGQLGSEGSRPCFFTG